MDPDPAYALGVLRAPGDQNVSVSAELFNQPGGVARPDKDLATANEVVAGLGQISPSVSLFQMRKRSWWIIVGSGSPFGAEAQTEMGLGALNKRP